MREVPRVQTPVSVKDAAEHLVTALRAIGDQPHRTQAELLLAQLWLETGRGVHCDNNNVGNITAGPAWTGDAFRPAWFTVDEHSSARLRELHDAMAKGKAPSSFRSYATLDAGFADYCRQLATRFPSILRAARAGDAHAVSAAIRASGYNPENPIDATAASLRSLANEFARGGVFAALPLAPPAATPPQSPPSSSSPCS